MVNYWLIMKNRCILIHSTFNLTYNTSLVLCFDIEAMFEYHAHLENTNNHDSLQPPKAAHSQAHCLLSVSLPPAASRCVSSPQRQQFLPRLPWPSEASLERSEEGVSGPPPADDDDDAAADCLPQWRDVFRLAGHRNCRGRRDDVHSLHSHGRFQVTGAWLGMHGSMHVLRI